MIMQLGNDNWASTHDDTGRTKMNSNNNKSLISEKTREHLQHQLRVVFREKTTSETKNNRAQDDEKPFI